MGSVTKLTVQIEQPSDEADALTTSEPVKKTFAGRAAWALDQLIKAGPRGCTPIDNPAPRWSHYVFLLRRGGVPVKTNTENHAGAFAGHHARYTLDVPVSVLEEERA